MIVVFSNHTAKFDMDFNTPGKKRKASVEMPDPELQIPIMTNATKIAKHTRLAVLEDASLKQLLKTAAIENLKSVGASVVEAHKAKKAKPSENK